MKDERHPSELNAWQRYSRAKFYSKHTSRMKDPAWYQDALDLDVQVHCYFQNEGDIDCFLHIKSQHIFQKIEGLTQRQLQMADELENFVNRILASDGVKKAKSLGIIFYLADELSIASLGPEHQNRAELDDLRKMVIEDPTEVLEDKTVSATTHAWRLFPYPGASEGNEFATVVAVSRKPDHALRTLREIGNARNLPIRTHALSAPLCAIASLPWFTTAKEDGVIAVFNYETFTIVSFYNKDANLVMVRYMPHPTGSNTPANIGPAVMASATAFELESPEINVLSMVGHDLDAMNVSLQSSMMGSDIMYIANEEVLKEKELSSDIPLEMLVATMELDPELHPMAENVTFSAFKDEKWHLQDFLAPDQDELDMYPTEGAMKILKAGKKLKCVAALALIGVLGYSGYKSWEKINSPEWTHKPQDTQAIVHGLTTELQRYEHWNNMLMDRSKMWTTMELISRMAPEDGSVILKDVNHMVDRSSDKKSARLGFKKSWIINGYATEEGLRHLERISTRDGIKKIFKEVANDTGSNAFLPDVSQRDITVSMTQKQNPRFDATSPKTVSDKYKLLFNMSITQSFSATDELALARPGAGIK